MFKGNLTATPELKPLTFGDRQVSMARFTLAVDRIFKKANGDKDKETTFIPCEIWDTGAETLVNHCVKGDALLIEGTLKIEKWEKDGQKHSQAKIRVSNFDRLTHKKYDNKDNFHNTPSF